MKKFVSILFLLGISISILAVSTGQIMLSKNGVVAAANPYAAAAGAEILEKGGNAVDAAVAVAFALGVVEPYASGLGGEGVMIIHTSDGQNIAIDYKSVAPMDLSKYTKSPSNYSSGPLSVCVPGVVDGLIKALSEWGTMNLSEVMEPAIRLAREGFVLNETYVGVLSDNYEKLLNDPGEGALVYLKDNLLYDPGDLFKNPVLADTLELIAKEGRDVFYKGEIADKIVKFMQENGGAITKQDLEQYHAIVKEPIIGTYRGYKIITAPQPVGGTTLVEILNILERFNISDLSWDDPLYIHLLSEALYLATIDMRIYCGDDPNVPVEALISKEYAKSRFEMIPLSKAIARSSSAAERQKLAGDPFKYLDNKKFFDKILEDLGEKVKIESPSTTHASVVDKWGNAVAFTQTLSSFFGSGNVVPGTGIILNNEMANFSTSGPNALAPGRRPRTTIAPTIVLRPNGDLLMVVGTPGASRILSTLSQMIVNVIDFGYSIDQAMKLPKFCSYDTYTDLKIEGGFPEETIKILEKYYGYKLELYPELDLFFGGPNCVYKQEDGIYIGVGSFRRQGAAAVPEK
ncbi:gamma-glutamyltransferase [Thermotoga profunda]|uniref:gamma-glutamyltransferase n=1 Tax=Thermotoga profunda TaxID=1508420 RepID=UPI000694E7FF|nr:gamma-glutamyltransferase [Thermotoga profunda]